MLRVSMHQPNFLPYVGFFEKVARSDLFIIMDHLDFSKGKDNWHHRNRVRVPNPNGWDFLTLPVSEHWNWRPFTEARISEVGQFKKRKHIKSIIQNYSKVPLFNDFFPEFSEIYMKENPQLSEFNTSLIMFFLEKFKIKTPVLKSSELGNNPLLQKDDMIIDTMKRVSGTHFLSGDGAKTYIQPQEYEKNDIVLEFQDFKPHSYDQAFPGFVPYLSAIDLLFNTGKLKTNGQSFKMVDNPIPTQIPPQANFRLPMNVYNAVPIQTSSGMLLTQPNGR